MIYRVNWNKSIKVLSISFILLVMSLAFRFVIYQSTLTTIFFFISLFIFLLCVLIIIGHFSSSLKIENGLVKHLIFGFTKVELPFEDLVEYKEEKSIFPGILIFADGNQIRVSGIAIGEKGSLPSFLKKHGNEIKFSLYE